MRRPSRRSPASRKLSGGLRIRAARAAGLPAQNQCVLMRGFKTNRQVSRLRPEETLLCVLSSSCSQRGRVDAGDRVHLRTWKRIGRTSSDGNCSSRASDGAAIPLRTAWARSASSPGQPGVLRACAGAAHSDARFALPVFRRWNTILRRLRPSCDDDFAYMCTIHERSTTSYREPEL